MNMKQKKRKNRKTEIVDDALKVDANEEAEETEEAGKKREETGDV